MPLTQEQFKTLRGKGLTVDQIVKFDSGQKPTQEPLKKPSILEPKKGFDAFSFPRTAAKTGVETARAFGRIGARPFVQLARGFQQLAPGGKTGLEDINIPGLGKFKGDKTGLPPIRETGVEAGETLLAGKGEAILRPVIGKIKQLRTLVKGKESQKIIQEIEETISPKLTTREQRLAGQEGRVIRGEESKLFGKKPDVVIQSNKVKKSAGTINRRIPEANKFDDQVLNSKIKNEVTTSAKNLSPQLKTINVAPNSVKKLKGSWDTLKKQQIKNPEFDVFTGSKKMQSNFEEFLNEASKSVKGKSGKFRQKNLDDIWDIRKRYDESISDAIKQADSQSNVTDQFKKEMWLDNRRMLNELMEDMSQDLDETTKQIFDEMADLYRARQNIIGKTKVDLNGTEGLISFRRALQAGAGVVGVGVLGKLFID